MSEVKVRVGVRVPVRNAVGGTLILHLGQFSDRRHALEVGI